MSAARGLQRLPYLQLPLLLRAYVGLVVVAALGLFGWLLYWELPSFDDLGMLAFLLLCGALVAETSRGFLRGMAGGFTQDLNTIWKLPIILLLSPALALPATLFLTLLWSHSIRKSVALHRRAFNVAMIGIGDMLAALFFQSAVDEHSNLVAFAIVAILAGALSRIVNHLLLSGIIVLTRAGSVKRIVLDKEAFAYDGVEICVGLIVTLLAMQAVPLVVLVVPPVILLHRSLLHEQLRNMSRTDAKTAVLNVGAWEHDAKEELARAKKAGESTSVLLCDIDHFKVVNDEHGHLAGDTALRVVAQRMKALLRQGDILGRFGGEEFVILLSGIGVVNARSIAERLRRSVAADPVTTDNGSIGLTVSLGVATLEESDGSLAEMMAAADEALYAAKRGGRNQVVVARKLGGKGESVVVGSESPSSVDDVAEQGADDSGQHREPAEDRR